MAEHDFVTLLEIKEEFGTCDICQEDFDGDSRSPRSLPCSHTFCCECLECIWGKSTSGVQCPKCRRFWPVQEDIKTTFHQNNVLMNLVEYLAVKNKPENISCWQCPKSLKASIHCLDCQKYMCDECSQFHMRFLPDHKTVSLSQFIKSPQTFFQQKDVCKDHERMKMDLFCKNETCLMATCMSCVYVCHRDHEICNLKDVYQEKKNLLTTALDDLHKSSVLSSTYRDTLIEQKKTLDKKLKSMLQFVDSTSNEIIEQVKEKTKQMKEDIVKNIAKQQDDRDSQLQVVDQAENAKSEHALCCKQALSFTRATQFISMFQDLVNKTRSLTETPDLFDMQIQEISFDLVTFEQIRMALKKMEKIYDVSQIRPCIDVTDIHSHTGEDSDFVKVSLIPREDGFLNLAVLLQATIQDPGENESRIQQNVNSICHDGGSLSYRTDLEGPHRARISVNGHRLNQDDIVFNCTVADAELTRRLFVSIDGKPGNYRELSLPPVHFNKERLNWECRSINNEGFLTNIPADQPDWEHPDRLRQFCGVPATAALNGPGCKFWLVKVRKEVLASETDELGYVGVQTGFCHEHSCDVEEFEKNERGCCVEVRTCPEHDSVCLYVFSRGEFLRDCPIAGFKTDLVIDVDLGFLIDFERNVVHLIHIQENKVIYSITDVDATQPLMPLFGVYSPSLFNVKVKVISGTDLSIDLALLSLLSDLIQP